MVRYCSYKCRKTDKAHQKSGFCESHSAKNLDETLANIDLTKFSKRDWEDITSIRQNINDGKMLPILI